MELEDVLTLTMLPTDLLASVMTRLSVQDLSRLSCSSKSCSAVTPKQNIMYRMHHRSLYDMFMSADMYNSKIHIVTRCEDGIPVSALEIFPFYEKALEIARSGLKITGLCLIVESSDMVRIKFVALLDTKSTLPIWHDIPVASLIPDIVMLFEHSYYDIDYYNTLKTAPADMMETILAAIKVFGKLNEEVILYIAPRPYRSHDKVVECYTRLSKAMTDLLYYYGVNTIRNSCSYTMDAFRSIPRVRIPENEENRRLEIVLENPIDIQIIMQLREYSFTLNEDAHSDFFKEVNWFSLKNKPFSMSYDRWVNHRSNNKLDYMIKFVLNGNHREIVIKKNEPGADESVIWASDEAGTIANDVILIMDIFASTDSLTLWTLNFNPMLKMSMRGDRELVTDLVNRTTGIYNTAMVSYFAKNYAP